MIRYKRSTHRSVAEKFQPSRRRISESRRASRLFNRRLNERLEGLNVQNGHNEYNAVGTLGSWTFNFVGDSDYTEEWYDDEWGGSKPYKEWRYTLDVKITHEGDTKPLRYYDSSRSRIDFYDKAEKLWQRLLDKCQSNPDLTQSDIINTLTSSGFRKFGI